MSGLVGVNSNATYASRINIDQVEYLFSDGSTIVLTTDDKNRWGHAPIDDSPGDLALNPEFGWSKAVGFFYLPYSDFQIGHYDVPGLPHFQIDASRVDGVEDLINYLYLSTVGSANGRSTIASAIRRPGKR